MNCPQCGAPLESNATKCKYCGEPITNTNANANTNPAPQMNYQANFQPQQPIYTQPVDSGVNPSWPIKNKIVAAVLAFLFGGLGAHKFYLGQIGMGILYLIFSWTLIPAILGCIDCIIYLTSNDHNFQVKNRVRLQ